MIRNSLKQTSAAKHDAELALQVARDAAMSANASRYELDKIIDEMNDFLKDARFFLLFVVFYYFILEAPPTRFEIWHRKCWK